jgi:hypothetical protein
MTVPRETLDSYVRARLAEEFGRLEDEAGIKPLGLTLGDREPATLTKLAAWMPIDEDTLEDLGYPPSWKGLEYWHQRERWAIDAGSIRNRIRRPARRLAWLARDLPRRLRNARAAIAGEWEADDDR